MKNKLNVKNIRKMLGQENPDTFAHAIAFQNYHHSLREKVESARILRTFFKAWHVKYL